jgi:hypothetical protein
MRNKDEKDLTEALLSLFYKMMDHNHLYIHEKVARGEMMRKNNWILFFLLLGASFLWGVIYWMFIAK